MTHGDIPGGYNTPVPAQIMTPDRVETRIGGHLDEGVDEAATDRLERLRSSSRADVEHSNRKPEPLAT